MHDLYAPNELRTTRHASRANEARFLNVARVIFARSYHFALSCGEPKGANSGLTRIVHSFKNKYFNNICAAL
jgi:hypothetical protein